jgi:hypothetical protein
LMPGLPINLSIYPFSKYSLCLECSLRLSTILCPFYLTLTHYLRFSVNRLLKELFLTPFLRWAPHVCSDPCICIFKC